MGPGAIDGLNTDELPCVHSARRLPGDVLCFVNGSASAAIRDFGKPPGKSRAVCQREKPAGFPPLSQ
jgi:hypothetical protein